MDMLKGDVAIGELLPSVSVSKLVELPIATTANAIHMGQSTIIRLGALDKRAVVYTKKFTFANGLTKPGPLVESGEYIVDAPTFTHNCSRYTVYVVKFVVKANGFSKLDIYFTFVSPRHSSTNKPMGKRKQKKMSEDMTTLIFLITSVQGRGGWTC
ncbi:hypothetical protein F5Y10DRAFT_272919 [Nemania abortiva]|nr:hypothetical protein F5Y10DRAFT_272919 [Nemania abortiva]